jgi:hypothetical protein
LIEAQPTELPEVEMAERPSRGKKVVRPTEPEEDWDEEIEKEERDRARRETKKAVVESSIRPEADSDDSYRGHSSEELDEVRDIRDSRYREKVARKKMGPPKSKKDEDDGKIAPPHLESRRVTRNLAVVILEKTKRADQ